MLALWSLHKWGPLLDDRCRKHAGQKGLRKSLHKGVVQGTKVCVGIWGMVAHMLSGDPHVGEETKTLMLFETVVGDQQHSGKKKQEDSGHRLEVRLNPGKVLPKSAGHQPY